jgi:NADH-quinone oxidoreductase subunit A
MNPFFIHFFPILIALIFSVILSFVIFCFSIFLSFQYPDAEKFSAYECGFDPFDHSRNIFDIKFYLIALIFVIFDLETMFIFP